MASEASTLRRVEPTDQRGNNVDNDSVAKQMNRGLFLAPDLDNDEDDDPLLEQARENVDDDVEEIEEKREGNSDNKKDRP
jgi:hypothetical protein